MARSEDLKISANVWTEITANDVTKITFQNKSNSLPILVQVTVGSVAPTVQDGTKYEPYQGEYDLTLSSAFPGVVGANRVWVYSSRNVEVFVSHA